MPLKVYYFALPGRAEVPRLLLSLGNIEYQDVHLSFSDGPNPFSEFKAKAPFGQVPVLELEDGKMLAQSNAITLYCAKLAGMYPADNYEAALQDQACGLMEDIWMVLAPTMRIKDKEEQIKTRQELLAGPFKEKANYLSKLIEGCQGGFIGGDKMSYGDLTIFTQLSAMKSGWLDGVPQDLWEEYPVLKAFRNKIANQPGVKSFYEKHTDGIRHAYKADE